MKVGLFYGSDTGITEEVTHDIVNIWQGPEPTIVEASNLDSNSFDEYDIILIGLSTWYDGDLQSDWDDFFEEFKSIDFSGKKVAIYGLGDQIGYPEYFVDGIGILAEVIIENGGKIVGHWPVDGYDFTESKALVADNESLFYGLALDEDNQSDQTTVRIEAWLKQISQELQITEMVNA